jgi:hypothetical protein
MWLYNEWNMHNLPLAYEIHHATRVEFTEVAYNKTLDAENE